MFGAATFGPPAADAKQISSHPGIEQLKQDELSKEENFVANLLYSYVGDIFKKQGMPQAMITMKMICQTFKAQFEEEKAAKGWRKHWADDHAEICKIYLWS